MVDPYPNRTAFLAMIAWSEGTSRSPATKNAGYDVIVTGADGKPEVFTDYSAHPFAGGRAPKVINKVGLQSTASGRYQVLLRFWLIYQRSLGLPDFSPASQDAVALQMIRECAALPLIDSGDIDVAIKACASRWASLPGANYPGQSMNKAEALTVQYVAFGGTLKGATA